MLNTDLVRCSAVIFIWGQFYKKRLNQQLLKLNGKLFFLKFHSNLSGVNELTHCQGWGQLHNINSTPTPTPEVSTPTPTPANLKNINSNSNSNSGSFNSNSNSGKSPEYQLQLQLQLREFQLQLQFQLRRFQLQFQLQLRSFKSNPNSISNPINLVQLNYHYPITMFHIVWIKWRYAVDICHVVPNLRSNRSTLA